MHREMGGYSPPSVDYSANEQIDLDTDCYPLLNRALEPTNVLPILDSIVEREGCTLMHLHFPSMWRDRESFSIPGFYAFIGRYNEMRKNQGIVHCLECSRILPDRDGWIPYGIMQNTVTVVSNITAGCVTLIMIQNTIYS